MKCEGTKSVEQGDVEAEEEDDVEEKRTVSVQNPMASKEKDEEEEEVKEDILHTLIESGAEESDFTDDNEGDDVNPPEPFRIVKER